MIHLFRCGWATAKAMALQLRLLCPTTSHCPYFLELFEILYLAKFFQVLLDLEEDIDGLPPLPQPLVFTTRGFGIFIGLGIGFSNY